MLTDIWKFDFWSQLLRFYMNFYVNKYKNHSPCSHKTGYWRKHWNQNGSFEGSFCFYRYKSDWWWTTVVFSSEYFIIVVFKSRVRAPIGWREVETYQVSLSQGIIIILFFAKVDFLVDVNELSVTLWEAS